MPGAPTCMRSCIPETLSHHANHCRANAAHTRQSWPDCGLGCQAKVLKSSRVASSPVSGFDPQRESDLDEGLSNIASIGPSGTMPRALRNSVPPRTLK